MRDRGCESRQDGVLAQMKTVPGYVFFEGGYNCECVYECLEVCVCVSTCARMCASQYVEGRERMSLQATCCK